MKLTHPENPSSPQLRKHLTELQREFKRTLIKDIIAGGVHDVDVKRWTLPDDVSRLRGPASYKEELHLRFAGDRSCKGDKMPALKTHGKLQFRPGEVTLWPGYKESYKSTFLNELFTYWACSNVNVAQASLEMPAIDLLEKSIIQALANDKPTVDQVEAVIEELTETLILYDVTGRVSPKHLAAVMYFCAKGLNCKHFLLDNLTMALPASNDRLDTQLEFCQDCIAVAKTTGMHIHLVAHCSKPENGDESKMPSGYNVRGLGSVPDMVDNIIVAWRNKPKEDRIDADRATDEDRKQPDFVLRVDKQRWWPYRGRLNFWVNQRVMRFCEGGILEADPFLR